MELQLCMCVLALLASVAQAEGQTGGVTFRGTTRSGDDSAPLVGVEIRLPQLRLRTTSDERGAFTFARIPDGRWVLQLRRLGFEPLDTIVNPTDARLRTVEFALRALPPQLDTVSVSSAAELAGVIPEFDERRARGLGIFLSRKELRASDDRALVDVLRSRVPGLGLQVGASGVHAYSRSQQPPGALKSHGGNARKLCYSQVVLDGVTIYQQDNGAGPPIDPPDISEFLVRSLDGIEYYSGPSRTPPEFRAMGATCGTLVLWSRRR